MPFISMLFQSVVGLLPLSSVFGLCSLDQVSKIFWLLLGAPGTIASTPSKLIKFHFFPYVKLIWIDKYVSVIRIV